MRRRLRKFFPIVLIALMVQIFAPIGACWAASIAASDPLHAAVICHGDTASAQGQTNPPCHQPERVVWLDSAPDLFGSRSGSHAQARAPPLLT